MNTFNDNMHEDIDVNVTPVTMNLPLQVTMRSKDACNFDFTVSVDPHGHILLTPVDPQTEFVSAILRASDDSVEAINSEDTQVTTISLTANMLQEDTDTDIDITIDSIGQCVISPVSLANMFVTATVNDSLDLASDEPTTVDYFGYTLRNNNDNGWDVIDYTGNVVCEHACSEAAAKIAACSNELKLLEALSDDSNEEEPVIPEVTATVEHDNTEKLIESLTNNYTDLAGTIACDTESEVQLCEQLLSAHYDLTRNDRDNRFVVSYVTRGET